MKKIKKFHYEKLNRGGVRIPDQITMCRKIEEIIDCINNTPIDYKSQCLCGSKEFFNQKFKVYLTYDAQQFRICKKCGTMKILSGYYNDEECKYMDTVQYKEKKGE